jgi:murein DD-endopeptidase MepM/ murein hydrolase activator NlpD
MSGFTPEQYWDGLFLRPSTGVLTSQFGVYRLYNNTDLNSFHSGSDFAARTGTPIYAPAAGYVVDTGILDVRGYIIIVDHGLGVYTGYWHLASIQVNPGDRVEQGQLIGTMGTTGLSSASHLHWEMWVNGINVDATQWLRVRFP